MGYPIYKIVELAAENIIKHSKARTARIAVQIGADATRVEVSDDGCGFIVEKVRHGLPGTGLVLMEQYANEIGFDLEIDSYPNRGTIVRTQTK
jgi:signal transduction histidine kinase